MADNETNTGTDNSDSLEEASGSAASTATDSSVIETDSLEGGSVQAAPGQQSSPAPKKSGRSGLKRFSHRFNIYLLLFALVLVISGAVVIISITKQHTTQDPKIASQSLPTDALKQLATSDATVGDPKQILNVQSNAVFAGKVLVRDSLDVAGTIHVNGSLSLPGITVSGESTFDQVQVNKALSIGGDASVLGQLNVKKNLAVTGGGTFGGSVTAPQIATSQLQLLGNLVMTNHIVAGGATPSRSGGGALGGGGTASVSGSDTAGSININVGSGAGAGCFITVNFTNKFDGTPHVVITPTSATAATINYYVSRTTTGFSVCSASTPQSGGYSFDYIVIG